MIHFSFNLKQLNELDWKITNKNLSPSAQNLFNIIAQGNGQTSLLLLKISDIPNIKMLETEDVDDRFNTLKKSPTNWKVSPT